MSSTIHETETSQQARMKERVKQHKAEVARLREELGDPELALSQFVVEHFELQAMMPNASDSQGPISEVLEDDDDADAR